MIAAKDQAEEPGEPGSEGGGWKRARKSNALTAYPTPERVCPKV